MDRLAGLLHKLMFSQSLFIQDFRKNFFLEQDIPITSFGDYCLPLTTFVGHFRRVRFMSLKQWNPAQENRENPSKI